MNQGLILKQWENFSSIKKKLIYLFYWICCKNNFELRLVSKQALASSNSTKVNIKVCRLETLIKRLIHRILRQTYVLLS
jgi:hypothetical protein